MLPASGRTIAMRSHCECAEKSTPRMHESGNEHSVRSTTKRGRSAARATASKSRPLVERSCPPTREMSEARGYTRTSIVSRASCRWLSVLAIASAHGFLGGRRFPSPEPGRCIPDSLCGSIDSVCRMQRQPDSNLIATSRPRQVRGTRTSTFRARSLRSRERNDSEGGHRGHRTPGSRGEEERQAGPEGCSEAADARPSLRRHEEVARTAGGQGAGTGRQGGPRARGPQPSAALRDGQAAEYQ